MNERWRDIPNFENCYKASNLGRVRSLDRQTVFKDGRARTFKGKIIKTQIRICGYEYASLCKEGVESIHSIHRLVLSAFRGLEENLQVNHIDGNKLNNNITNLEWVTASENVRHAVKVLGHRLAERNPAAVITNKQALEIIRLSKKELAQVEIAEIIGCSRLTVSRVITGKNFSSITGIKYKRSRR